MSNSNLFAFLGLAFVLTVTPGADTMLVLRNAVIHGQRSGIQTVLGGCGGILIHAVLSAAGLSLVLVKSAAAYEVVKLLGAAYLVGLGLKSIGQALRNQSISPLLSTDRSSPHYSDWHSLRDGLLTNVLNPKTALFYLALLPQFIQPDDRLFTTSLFLAGLHITMRFLWLSLVTLLLQPARALITRRSVQRNLEATTGAILCLLGFRLAVAQRE